MLNQIKKFCVFIMVLVLPMLANAAGRAMSDVAMQTDESAELAAEQMSADAVAAYNVDGSLFQQITDLEQEKILKELEKERAQLDLELDRLSAEKLKLRMEIETLSGRAEQQQQEFETEKAKLEAEAARLAREKESLRAQSETVAEQPRPSRSYEEPRQESSDTAGVSEKYRLINVFGAGTQLQATVEHLDNGQSKRISVGKKLDGWTVKSISLDEGVVFTKGGETETLNIAND